MLAWYGSETYAMPMAISPSKSNAPITFNIFFILFIFCAKVMQTECRTTSLLDCYAEV